MNPRLIWIVQCSGCGAKLKESGCCTRREIDNLAAYKGWRSVDGDDYCPSCARGALLADEAEMPTGATP